MSASYRFNDILDSIQQTIFEQKNIRASQKWGVGDHERQGVAGCSWKTECRILKDFHFLNPKIKVRTQSGELVRAWRGVHFDVPVAVHNPPSTLSRFLVIRVFRIRKRCSGNAGSMTRRLLTWFGLLSTLVLSLESYGRRIAIAIPVDSKYI